MLVPFSMQIQLYQWLQNKTLTINSPCYTLHLIPSSVRYILLPPLYSLGNKAHPLHPNSTLYSLHRPSSFYRDIGHHYEIILFTFGVLASRKQPMRLNWHPLLLIFIHCTGLQFSKLASFNSFSTRFSWSLQIIPNLNFSLYGCFWQYLITTVCLPL